MSAARDVGETLALCERQPPEMRLANTTDVTYPYRHRNPGGSDLARRVRDLLRSRLLHEEFGEDRLPDDEQLMREYRAGRGVIRSALSALQNEGLIERKQGVGTFPVRVSNRHQLIDANGLGASLSCSSLRMSSRLVTKAEVPASPELARELRVAPGATCLAIDVVTSIGGTPAVILTSYLADSDVGQQVCEFLRVGVWAGDWYDALEQAGLRALKRTVLIEAVLVDELISPFLAVPVGHPSIRFQRRLCLGPSDTPEYGFSYCRSDLVTFEVNDHLPEQEGSYL